MTNLALWLNIATAPVMTHARPSKTWIATIVRNMGEVDGTSIPATLVMFLGPVFYRESTF